MTYCQLILMVGISCSVVTTAFSVVMPNFDPATPNHDGSRILQIKAPPPILHALAITKNKCHGAKYNNTNGELTIPQSFIGECNLTLVDSKNRGVRLIFTNHSTYIKPTSEVTEAGFTVSTATPIPPSGGTVLCGKKQTCNVTLDKQQDS